MTTYLQRPSSPINVFSTLRVYRCLQPNMFEEWIATATPTELSERIKYLNLCECCDRHKKSKPADFVPNQETVCTNNPNSHLLCDCPCRHMARFICRQHPDCEPCDEETGQYQEPETGKNDEYSDYSDFEAWERNDNIEI